jgi:hypothetical protein
MRNTPGRLAQWKADALDRSLLTVPSPIPASRQPYLGVSNGDAALQKDDRRFRQIAIPARDLRHGPPPQGGSL